MISHEIFLKAINEKWIVAVVFNSVEKGIIKRKCVPYDFGPSRRFNDGLNRYHFNDLENPKGPHNLSILPENLRHIQILDEKFEPKDFVHWKPRWCVPRDWGIYS